MSVILTKASSAKSIVITRALGEKGIDVINCDSTRFSPAFYSRYSTANFLYPSPAISPRRFISHMLYKVKKTDADVLMPVHSEETYLISQYKDKFENYIKVPVPSFDKIQIANDKSQLMELARSLGLPSPKTFTPASNSDISGISKQISYPAVIKLKDSTSSKGIYYAANPLDLEKKFKSAVKRHGLATYNLPLIQEYIPGEGYGVELLYNNGSIRACFTHKRIREYPMSGGPSTVRISTREPDMEKIARKLMDVLGWHGLAMVEFKRHAITKKPYILEVNPRFWGSINQAIVSGINFPHLLYTMAVEGDVKPAFQYKVGVKTKFVLFDWLAMPQYLRAHNNEFTLSDFLQIKRYHCDVLSLTDPLPAMVLTMLSIKRRGL